MVFPAVPRDAAALVVFDWEFENILWARRNDNLKFLGGFHSFPGGKVEEEDSEVEVRNARDPQEARLIACAVRETFEEVGVLLVRNGERLTVGQIPLLHDDLVSGRETFAYILKHWGLWIDASDFHYAGEWTTPEFSPVRFRTSFFAAKCPQKQIPYPAVTELVEVDFWKPDDALRFWEEGKSLMAPPVIEGLRVFSNPEVTNIEQFSSKYELISKERGESPATIELTPRIMQVPLRTNTLPPATHTNCFIVGREEFVVIDAATPFEVEQQKLFEVIDGMLTKGCKPLEIIVSHLHPDHFGGEVPLKQYLSSKHGVDVPISAHSITIDSLKDKVTFDRETKDSYPLKARGKEFVLEVLHTPGHARGHLCFYDVEQGFLLTSDNIVGQGTVVIAPPEGNMRDYLQSLEEMKELEGLNSLAGSHGAAVKDAKARIQSYIDHRLEREEQVLRAFNEGATDLTSLRSIVYSDLNEDLIPLAQKSCEAHVAKLIEDGKVNEGDFDFGI